MNSSLTNSSELTAFVASYIVGQFLARAIAWVLIPWLIQNGQKDAVVLAGWVVSFSVMPVVLGCFLIVRRMLGVGVSSLQPPQGMSREKQDRQRPALR